MGIHYDYKSTRGDKAMKKEAKRKARIEQRRAKRSSNNSKDASLPKIYGKLFKNWKNQKIAKLVENQGK